jgi:hypothetical protein
MKLYRMVNEYRKQYDLPPIPLSRSLSYVASVHAKDLFLHHPDAGPCNFHSWSAHGTWKPFCYPRDENKKSSVWDKPKEITRYPGKGFEIVYWENNPVVIDSVINVWKSEEYFVSFLLNTGKWDGKKWNAIGIGIWENYACAWFGEVTDPEGAAWECGSKPMKAPADTTAVKPGPKAEPKPKPGVKPPQPKPKADTLKAEKPSDTVQKAVPADTSRVFKGTYYIIVRSGVPLNQADKAVAALKEKGYADPKVLEKDGKARISIFESRDKDVAMAKLRETKKTIRDAWLLKEKD